jgi:hypothetical protein
MALSYRLLRTLWIIALPLQLGAGASIAWSWSLAWLPALLGAVVFGLYAWLILLERSERRRRLRTARVPASPWALPASQRIGFRLMAVITLGLAACAIILAAALMERPAMALGALVFFLLLLFIGLPFWAAAAGEAVDFTATPATDHPSGMSDPLHPRTAASPHPAHDGPPPSRTD